MLLDPRNGISIALAVVRAQMRAELMATQSWLQDEVAALRKELAAARAELHRLRATQRDPDATLGRAPLVLSVFPSVALARVLRRPAAAP